MFNGVFLDRFCLFLHTVNDQKGFVELNGFRGLFPFTALFRCDGFPGLRNQLDVFTLLCFWILY